MSYGLISLPFRLIYLTHAWFFTFDVLLLSRRRARAPLAICTLLIFSGVLVNLYSKCGPATPQYVIPGSRLRDSSPGIPSENPTDDPERSQAYAGPPVQTCQTIQCPDNREWVENEISLLTSRLESLEGTLRKCHCTPPEPAPTLMSSNIQPSHDSSEVQQICRQILRIYDADRTNLPDYAVESGGGTVVSTRCSETYENNMGRYYLFNFIPLFWKRPSPRLAIQPTRDVGECWPFRGTVGYLVLQLSRKIEVQSVTLEHIPSSIALEGNIKSAPKDFQVYGLTSADDTVGKLLGNFSYSLDADPWQNFKVEPRVNETFDHVELKILSNHGNIHYTCLYRFRVHGKPVEDDDSTW